VSDFRVLAVCRANYCRSPIAAVMLQSAADDILGPGAWGVRSAGVDVRFDADMHLLAREVLQRRGFHPHPHRTHQVDSADLASADLILTASRAQRSAVVTLLPAAVGRTFTLLQFARLADLVGPIVAAGPREAGLALVREAKHARADLQPASPELDDLVDPIGRPRPAFEACAATVQDAVNRIMRPLRQ
jgi:protein-tyrosine phosphatase